jgi:hypothetical protein
VIGDRARNNRVGDAGNGRPCTEGHADQVVATPNRLGAKLNDDFKH